MSLGIGVRPVPEPLPAQYLNVRLSNGTTFYNAGGVTVSGGGVLTADQGVPSTLSNAWPVKLSDGTNVYGSVGSPLNVVLASGGLAAATPAQPLWVTGSVSVLNHPTTSTTLSGSVVGLLYGGQPASSQNPFWTTGSVSVVNHPTTTTALSGSVVGLLAGGQAVSSANRLPITGAVVLAEAPRVKLYDPVHNKDMQFSAFGVLKTAPEQILADYRFNTSSIAADWTVTTAAGGGHVIEPGGTGAKLISTSTNGSKVTFQSTYNTTYQSGRGVIVKQSTILGDYGVAGNVREWGYYSPTGTSGSNGCLVRISGTQLSWVIAANGVETVIPASSWDVPLTSADPYGHVWYQQLEWLGVGNIYLYYDEALVHTYRFIGTSLSFSLGTPDLPVWYRNENVSAGSSTYLKIGCASVVSEGGPTAIRIGDTISAYDSAQLGKSVITGKTTAGGSSYVDVKVSPAGAVQIGGTVDQGTGGSSAWLVTGSVGLTSAVAVSSLPSVTAQSGSVVGLLLGGNAVSSANPLPITGSVSLTQAIAVSSLPTITTASGSVTGLLLGGLNVSNAVPIPISDAGGSLTVDGSAITLSGSVVGLLVGGVAASKTNPLPTEMSSTGTMTNGAETTVGATAVQILAANSARKSMMIQNTGAANIRWGVSGVLATTGHRLAPGDTAALTMPWCPSDAIYAIRESSSSIAFALEIT